MSDVDADLKGTSYASEASRIRAINRALGADRLAASPLARCLGPLMVALDWFGAPRNLVVNLSPEKVVIETADLSRMLEAQGFRLQSGRWKEWQQRYPNALDALPVGSIVLQQEQALVYLGRFEGYDWWHNGTDLCTDILPSATDQLLRIEPETDFVPLDAPQTGWFRRLIMSARREISGILLVSLCANILTLAISLFTMFVYNTVIPSGATSTLWAMSVGAILAIFGAWGLRLARGRMVAHLSGWAGVQISDMTLNKTLGLPVELSARMGVENNLIRLRSLEGVRQWFGGAGGVVSADYPFVLIFLFVIALLGGWIVVVPLLGLLLFFLLAWPFARMIEARASRSSRITRKLGEMTTVLTKRLRALRGVRGSALWDRYLSELVARSVVAGREHALMVSLAQTTAQALGMFTVLSTMGVGIALVLAGDMSTGGLIATMMLIWRITTPAQQMFNSQVRLKQLLDSGRQLQRLLSSVGEKSNPQLISPVSDLRPAIEADRLYYRYGADREPALSGISFKVEPGQVLAVVGPNGAGKTTLLEMIAGVRLPQNGRLCIDGSDLRQFDPADYRAWHGYLPQKMPGLPVTLPESLRLRNPTASDEEIKSALSRVAGPEWWRHFGVDSEDAAMTCKISPWREDYVALRGRYIVRLTSSILGNPPLILLDDPLGDCDPELDRYLWSLLDELRGTSTIIMTTHRPDLIQKSDLIAVLNCGELVHFGPVAQAQEEPQTSTSEEAAL